MSFIETGKTAEETGFGGEKMKNLVWGLFSLKCLLTLPTEKLKRHLDTYMNLEFRKEDGGRYKIRAHIWDLKP